MNSIKSIRVDLQVIADLIEPQTRVLDVGCADGQLLDYLVNEKQVQGRGLEISPQGVNLCVSKGLSVVQGDAEEDLGYYPDNAFDFVILSQTLQATHHPDQIVKDLLRLGKRAIVSFPNFGHWRVRSYLFFNGSMPVNDTLPYQWYNSPNMHFCTIKDFIMMCDEMGVTIERSIALDADGKAHRIRTNLFFANLLGEQAVFLLRKD
ncbi:Methionine biosynthesis protein MetW [Candidatus Terasakiella magnetica]|uniref:Methionine biosynthesis protein MetW n=1 Tax=Candidatus Terasakiella magnetica TaxID=1867952 RepID=A0A1C3RDV7_9PROT|nr:methionine biosynthesis protein MetW [Candidatus Terasakiella magnetica]SCA55476.1 Methionine biosynthesis protein MetW [Candidatus Terasakiella magnetica]